MGHDTLKDEWYVVIKVLLDLRDFVFSGTLRTINVIRRMRGNNYIVYGES